MFQFPMYQKSQGMPGAYGNPLAGLMDGEAGKVAPQEMPKNPFQMIPNNSGQENPMRLIPTRFNPLQKEQQMERDKTNLESLDMPQIEGLPPLNAIRKNPSYTRT